jgi:PKHD-type hydroxylase
VEWAARGIDRDLLMIDPQAITLRIAIREQAALQHIVRLILNDPKEYEGGELTIEDTFGNHGVKLKAGSLVVYPSSSIHQVTPVTRGERLACFMFIQSMVRDPGQRRLLFDMDMALLDLREQLGESDPVVRLTGAYHNLLRRWAES